MAESIKEKNRLLFEGIFKVKIVDMNMGKFCILDMVDAIKLLMKIIPQDYTFGYWSFGIDDSDGFSRIRIIDNKKSRYLDLKEVRDLLRKTIPSERYEFLVEKLNDGEI